jgi:succinate dehydrogenase/fumarate reductase flavoprotein subunit
MQRAVKEFVKSGQVQILTDTKVLGLLIDDNGSVNGVQVTYLSQKDESVGDKLYAPNVILATGGFAADRSDGSYLSKYRPELMTMPATAGAFSTGDGIGLATTVGAGVVDMDKVQIHPTGWVDSKDPTNPNKILAAELMRGVGGMLINNKGER